MLGSMVRHSAATRAEASGGTSGSEDVAAPLAARRLVVRLRGVGGGLALGAEHALVHLGREQRQDSFDGGRLTLREVTVAQGKR